MNVRIGMIQSAKELEIELADDADYNQVVQDINDSVARSDGMLWLTDRKGRRVGVAVGKIAYVEVSPEQEGRRVGFSAL